MKPEMAETFMVAWIRPSRGITGELGSSHALSY